MFSYVVAGLAFLLFLYNPLVEYYGFDSGSGRGRGKQPRPIPRTPRPPINESLLAGLHDDDDDDGLLPPLPPPRCPPDAYVAHVLSRAPLVLYVQGFLSAAERARLLEISEPLFEPSTVTHDGDATQRETRVRDSEVALLPREPYSSGSGGSGSSSSSSSDADADAGADDVVRCVERRALALQGWRRNLWIERLRTQRYGPGQHYAHHFDWGSGALGWGRASSMMAWVSAEGVEGGGTEFPLLRWDGDREKWCQWLECPEGLDSNDDSTNVGATFKPIAGNAVFWENFRPDGTGRGWDESWHAGLPVTQGTKVGLNVWSWGRLN